MKVINDAVDRVRKWERNRTPALRNMRYVLLKNRENLSKQDLERVKNLSLKICTSRQLKHIICVKTSSSAIRLLKLKPEVTAQKKIS